VATSAVSNYGLILELDRVGDQLDRHYLNGLSMNPLALGAVVTDEGKPDGERGKIIDDKMKHR
jgi:hypothetical protein